MKVTVLIENTTLSELVCEHGLSMFIEYKDKYYLLDAGATGVFMQNAEKMNIPLDKAECAVLSHGHDDHGGGFGKYLEKYGDTKVYAMKNIMEEYYSGSGGTIHYIGLPKEIAEKHGSSFEPVDKVVQICAGVYLVPDCSKGMSRVGKRTGLYKKRGEEMVYDDFDHELSLVFDTEKGLVIFNSCSHTGIVNIIEEVKKAIPNKNIYAFFGGLHMRGKEGEKEICIYTEQEIEIISDYLKKAGISKIYTGHCTGETAMRILKKYLGETVETIHTGRIINI